MLILDITCCCSGTVYILTVFSKHLPEVPETWRPLMRWLHWPSFHMPVHVDQHRQHAQGRPTTVPMQFHAWASKFPPLGLSWPMCFLSMHLWKFPWHNYADTCPELLNLQQSHNLFKISSCEVWLVYGVHEWSAVQAAECKAGVHSVQSVKLVCKLPR